MYSTSGQIIRIIVSYRIHFRPLSELGSFTLLSSHTGNDNLTNFVFKESCGGSIIIVQEKDWRKVYQDEVVIHEPITYTTDKNYNYSDNDDIIWEWNVLPEINLVVKNDDSKIYCNFYEKNIGLDDWDGGVTLLLDEGDVELAVTSIGDNSFQSDFTKCGLYKISVSYDGINGLSNTTSKMLPIPSDYNPSSVELEFTDRLHTKEISVHHSDEWFQKKHLNECILSFYPQKIDTSEDGMILNENGWETVSSDKKITTITTSGSDGFEVPLKSFPNGLYTVKTITNDLLGNKSENEYDVKWVYENVYKPDKSKITISEHGKITFEVDDTKEIDEIEIKLSNEDGQFVVSKPLNEYKNHEDNCYDFTIPPYEVENGDYTLTVSNVLYNTFKVNGASSFRKNGSSMSFTYNYSFDIVSELEPFIRFNGNVISAYLNYSLDFGEAYPNEVLLTINDETTSLPVKSPKYTSQLEVGENNIIQSVKFGNRTSTKKNEIEVSSLENVKESIIDYAHLGVPQLEYVSEQEEYKHYTDEDIVLISGFEILNSSVLDIHKTGIHDDGDDVYYLTDKDNIFKIDGEQLYTYYKVGSYSNVIGNTIYNRYCPVNLKNRLSKTGSIMNFPIESIKIDTLSTRESYDEENDTQEVLRYDSSSNTSKFGITYNDMILDSNTSYDFLYGIVKLTDINDENNFFYYDLKSQRKLFSENMGNVSYNQVNGMFYNVPIGEYVLELIFSSTDTNKTVENRFTKENPLNLKAISNYIITTVVNCTKNDGSSKGTLRVKWYPNYTNFVHGDLKFYYCITKDEPKSDKNFTEFKGDIWTNFDGQMYSFVVSDDVICSGEYYMYYYFKLADNYKDIDYEEGNEILVKVGEDEETSEPIYDIYRRIPYMLDGENVYDNLTIEAEEEN